MRKESRVLVCVTGQKSCARLIHDGAEIAAEEGASLSVVHVAKMGSNFLGSASEAEALEYLFAISKSHSADMMLLRNDDVVHTIAEDSVREGVPCKTLYFHDEAADDEKLCYFDLSKYPREGFPTGQRFVVSVHGQSIVSMQSE